MKILGAQIVVKALEDEGVRYTFGIPGTHNTELYDALENSKLITPYLVTDEQSASFMADGYARVSGQVGVVNVVPGAGLTHCLSGVAEAYMDNVPMVILACGIRNDTGRSYQLHHIDQMSIIRPVVKETLCPKNPNEIYPMMRRAFSIARNGTPGPVAIEIPANYYFLRQEIDGLETTVPVTWKIPGPTAVDLKKAAVLLGEAKHPALYLGQGAKGAGDLLTRLAETLQAPVVTTIQGKGVFSESHPLWLWNGFGNSAPGFVQNVMNRCDCLLAIGVRFGEVATASYGLTAPENLIHVDINAEVFNKNYPAKLAIESDARLFIEALIGQIPQRPPNEALRDAIRQGQEDFWREALAKPSAARVTPAYFFKTVQRLAGPEAIYVTDSGNGAFLAMEFLRLEAPDRFLGPIDYSCMGYCPPAAIGAKLAAPQAPVIGIAGDGAFMMTGLELASAANYEIAPMIFVFNDGELGQIAQFQRIPLNRATCSILHPFDWEAFAKSVGAAYLNLPNDDVAQNVIEQALNISRERRPTIVNVAIDYSSKTYFTRGVVKTNLLRMPWSERLRVISRAAWRHLAGVETPKEKAQLRS